MTCGTWTSTASLPARTTSTAWTAPGSRRKATASIRGKLLLDPYVKAVAGSFTWSLLGSGRGRDGRPAAADASIVPKGIVVADDFDWKGDRPLNRSLRHSVIYETHVRGLTMHPSSGAEHPGTFRGVTEMIPYLADLGMTALELLPVQEFDEVENPRVNPRTGERLSNYWGYNTISFFAPKGRYAASGALGQQVTEFKEMVRDAARGGDRGDPRHRLQPHGGGRRRGTHALLPRLGQRRLLHAGRGTRGATSISRGAGTR